MSQVDVIAIDGPVASGKGSVSSGVASRRQKSFIQTAEKIRS